MPKFIDLTGRRFGRLVAVEYLLCAPREPLGRWRCRCDCGGEKLVRAQCLTRNQTRSCGCMYLHRAPRARPEEHQRVVRTSAQHLTRDEAIERRNAILSSGANGAWVRLARVWSAPCIRPC